MVRKRCYNETTWHFYFVEPRAASETGRWFLWCPLRWQRSVPRTPAPILCPADFMSLLSWGQPRRCGSFHQRYFAVLSAACLSAPATLSLCGAQLSNSIRNCDVPRQRFLFGPDIKSRFVWAFTVSSEKTGRFLDSWNLRSLRALQCSNVLW